MSFLASFRALYHCTILKIVNSALLLSFVEWAHQKSICLCLSETLPAIIIIIYLRKARKSHSISNGREEKVCTSHNSININREEEKREWSLLLIKLSMSKLLKVLMNQKIFSKILIIVQKKVGQNYVLKSFQIWKCWWWSAKDSKCLLAVRCKLCCSISPLKGLW